MSRNSSNISPTWIIGVPLLLLNFSLLTFNSPAQTYEAIRDTGSRAYNALNFEEAIIQFEAAEVLAQEAKDAKQMAEIDSLIDQAKEGYIDAIVKANAKNRPTHQLPDPSLSILSGQNLPPFPDALRKKVLNSPPPGTLRIGENLFMDESEITNLDWKEFVYFMKRENGRESEELFLAIDHLPAGILPDTSVWSLVPGEESLSEIYYRHPAFDLHPVVGISHEQALTYCIWRSERVNELIYEEGGRWLRKLEDLGYQYKVVYRLPKLSEWEQVANAPTSRKNQPSDFPFGQGFHSKENRDKEDGFSTTCPVQENDPNFYGCYGMLGNVSEMVHERFIAKGGSFAHSVEDCVTYSLPGGMEIYDRPLPWLGFRCVAEIKIVPWDE